MTTESYQYQACGLDHIYLLNGFTFSETEYGRAMSIQNMDGLHRVIGMHLATKKRALTGAELRFLRIELGLSQPTLGKLLGKTDQTVVRWEKGQSRIDGPAERLVRLLYTQQAGGNQDVRGALQRLVSVDELVDQDACFEETQEGWRLREAA